MKKSIYLISVLLLTSYLSPAQTLAEAGKMYMRRQYDSAWTMTKQLIDQKNSAIDAWVLAGRIQTAKGNFKEAPAYFDKAMTFPNPQPDAIAWTLHDLGLCYFFNGEFVKAKMSLTGCVQLNGTKNATNAAKNSLKKLGLDDLYASWVTRESPHFIFHFQDTLSVGSVNSFMKSHEAAFQEINNFFQTPLPRKIDFFVWRDDLAAEGIFRSKLAFTDPQLCLTHTGPHHTRGHEITHSVSYYAVRPVQYNRLIGEGVCVHFSLSKKDNLSPLKGSGVTSIAEIWKSGAKESDEIIYPLGGELVGKLIKDFGREKFMKLLANQSYESAKKIYGADLDSLLEQMELDNSR